MSVAVDGGRVGARCAQCRPEQHLVGGKDRSTELRFERVDDADRPEAVPPDADRFGRARHALADPLEELAGCDPLLLARQLGRGGEDHVESRGPEVFAPQSVELRVEPRRVDEGQALDAEATERGDGRCGWTYDRQATCPG